MRVAYNKYVDKINGVNNIPKSSVEHSESLKRVAARSRSRERCHRGGSNASILNCYLEKKYVLMSKLRKTLTINAYVHNLET